MTGSTTPAPFIPTSLGEFRNIYRRADGTERHGPTWRDRGTAEAMREVLDGETFVELRDMRFADDLRPTGTAAVAEA